uniref:Werner Syndrome-like exonuclease n=1 Tax=Erigeron canadensis TaxID=72917 RepID=UPI001CB9A7C8|nr:Werner Syndrome-like exonuclease [Erigeron canadensis]
MENTNNSKNDLENWELEFTEEELDSLFQTASACSSSRRPFADSDTGNRPKTRRRLPDSLFNQSNLSSLVPCSRNRSSHPSYLATQKMRFPAMTFKGHIVYSRTFSEVEKAANELLKFVETKIKDEGRAVIGFDIEWRPLFKKGATQSRVAVLQMCADATRCYVMHIFHSGFPENLKSLLGDPRSLKVGVGIAGDARKVFNDHNVSVDALADLSRLANLKLGGQPMMWSMSALTEKLACKQVPKPSKIRLGNWEANPLSSEQLKYAATDAFVSWHLFVVLNNLPDADTRTNEVMEATTPS